MAKLNLGHITFKGIVGESTVRKSDRTITDSKEQTINELTTAFSNGEIDLDTLKGRLTSLSITPNVNSDTVTFVYNGKTYCVKQKKSTSSNTAYSIATLKNIYKFSDEIINKYFKMANNSQLTPRFANAKTRATDTKTTETEYVINSASGCKDISQIQNIVYQKCQKDMLFANFLNDKNKTTNSFIAMLKTTDGKDITKYNYQDYIDDLELTLGTDTADTRQKALDKFITDFSQGNLSYLTAPRILLAIGVQNLKTRLNSNNSSYQISFIANNKNYTITCNTIAAKSGSDNITVTTYSNDTIAKYNASETLINKYFDSVATENGNSLYYTLKNGQVFEQFIADAELENQPKVKNGVYTTTSSNGNKVETTYEEDKITQEIEYNGTSTTKLSMTTYNSDGGKTVANYKDGKISAEITYDKSGKTTAKTTYNSDGGKTVANYKDGEVAEETNYDKSGKTTTKTTYNSDGGKTVANYKDDKVAKETTYDQDNNMTTRTFYSSYDGSKTVTNYKDGKASDKTTYDKSGKITAKTTYNSDGGITVTNYEDDKISAETTYDKSGKTTAKTRYNSDGGITVINYKDGEASDQTTYDKSGKTTQKTTYNSDGGITVTNYKDGEVAEETTYDKSGKRTEKTTYNSDGGKTVTNYKDGNVTGTTKYDKNGNVVNESKPDGDYTTTNANGNRVVTTYKNGKVVKEVVYKSYSSREEVISSETVYNEDGTKTVSEYNYSGERIETQTTYDKDGNKKTFTEYNDNGTIYRQTEYDKDGNKTVMYNDSNGKYKCTAKYDKYDNVIEGTVESYTEDDHLVRTIYVDGKITKIREYPSWKSGDVYKETEYDKDGGKTVTNYGSNGKIILNKTTYDKSGTKLSESKYERYGWSDPVSGKYYSAGTYPAIITTTYNGSKTTETIKVNDGKTMLRETITDSDKNTKTVVSYANGKKALSQTTDANNNVLEHTEYDSAGNMTSKLSYEYENGKLKTSIIYDKNGNISTKTVYEYSADGKSRTEKVYDSKGNLKSTASTTIGQQNGREKLITNNYDTNNKLISTVVTWYNTEGNKYEDTYDKTGKQNNNGMITARKVYNSKDDTIKNTYTYTYSNMTDTKNYTRTDKCSDGTTTVHTISNGVTTQSVTTKTNGDIQTIIYDETTGKKKKSYYYTKSTGIAKTTDYDKNGNALSNSAIERLRSTGLTVKSQTPGFVLDKLLDPYGSTWGVSHQSVIKGMGGGDITSLLLALANPSPNSTTKNAIKNKFGNLTTLTNSSQINSKYRDVAKNIIDKQIGVFGYNADQVKGYTFASNSAVAKKMANNTDLKNYVKNNLDALINGTKNANGEYKSLEFTKGNDSDLYNSFHNVHVIDSSLNGTKLTLTILDTYDFDENASDSLSKIAAAGMKDGKLKPYYTLTEVTIDLTSLGFTAAKIQAMKK